VPADPVGQALGPLRFGIGVVAGPHRGHEDLRLPDFARVGVDHLHRHPGIVDEELLPGFVLIAHAGMQPFFPLPKTLAKLAVSVPIRIVLAVLQPQQGQRHAIALQLLVDILPIRQRNPAGACNFLGIEPRFQLFRGQPLRQRPVQPGCFGVRDVLADRAGRDPAAAGDLPVRQSVFVFQAQNFFDFLHGQTRFRHPILLVIFRRGWQRPSSLSSVFSPLIWRDRHVRNH